ncbi:hypothetical protein Tco_0288669 [Tanacetum coccineum]
MLIHENLFEVTNFATPEKNVNNTTNASLFLEDFNPPLYELPFHKEVPGLGALLSFSSKNEEKVLISTDISKITRKPSKTAQTRTRETEEHKRSQRFKAKANES